MKRKKITATDIARILNISQPSVSRAFQSHAPIADEKRRQILNKAIELGYMKERAEQLLQGSEPIQLAFIVSDMHNPFFSQLIKDFSKLIHHQEHYELSIHILENDHDATLEKFLISLKHAKVKGLFASSVSPDSTLPALCAKLDITLILINRAVKDHHVSAVACDNYQSSYQVAKFLHTEKGHTHFAFLMGQQGIATFEDRLAGVKDYLHHTQLEPLTILQCQQNYHSAYQKVKESQKLLESHAITTIIGGNDLMALGALDALRYELGLQVPKDMAVVGFDDIAMASWQAYQLSTVRQRTEVMSQEALELMKMSLDQNIRGLSRLSQGLFIMRQSC